MVSTVGRCPPPKICPPWILECDLIWNKGLRRCKHLKMRSWARVGPKSKDDCVYRRQRNSHIGRPCEHTGRDWSDLSTSQGLPLTPRSEQKQGMDVPKGSQKKPSYWHWFQTSGLQNCFKLPTLGYFVPRSPRKLIKPLFIASQNFKFELGT